MNGLVAGILVFVGAVLPLTIMLGYMGPALKSLQATNAMLMEKLENQKENVQVVRETVRATELPSSWAAPYNPPRYYQEDRGTCWSFATVGVFEQSYRANGIAKGYLAEDEYVRFNNQAYGLSMIEACKDHPDVCDVAGDFVYQNSTVGGEVWWLYALPELYDKLLPSSVCPYTDLAHEHECPAMADALAKNPVRFNITTMETAYNVEQTKKLMIEHQVPLAWSSTMHSTVYHFPCNDPYWKNREECRDITKVVPCPTDRYYGSEKCARVLGTMYNLDGEFFMKGPTIASGGHAMNVVGYNDNFVTKNGQKGGFIIKNSWHDAIYGTEPSGRGGRGSHSIQFWMQEISLFDERAICPGPLNPANWLSCAALQSGPSADDIVTRAKLGEEIDLSGTCLDDAWMANLLKTTLQPNEFKCTDATLCSTDERYRYFLLSYEMNAEQDLAQACMLQYDTTTKAQATVCTPFHIPAKLAYFFTPIDAQLEVLVDDEDNCGYWFWPYEMLEKQAGMYFNFFTTYFDFAWDDASYVANAAAHPEYNYDYLKNSTFTMKSFSFPMPSPFAKTRYWPDGPENL